MDRQKQQKTTGVVDLRKYRHRQRKTWLAKYGVRLDRFVANFIALHFHDDFARVSAIYQTQCREEAQLCWDYHDLRETLEEAIATTFGDQIYGELQRQFWFDERIVSRDEVMERVTSSFVLGMQATPSVRNF